MAAQLASWTIDWCSSGCQGWANGKGRRGRVSWWEGSPPAPYSLTPIGLARERAGRLVEEGPEAVGLPVVPAEVAVEGDRVGDGHERVRGPEEARRGCRSARVLLLRERLELLHVRELRGPAAPPLRELVVEAPQEDRGVVHPLADHLPQLLLAVFAEGGGVGVAAHEAVHERDLDPGQEPRAVAQLEEVLGVGVVGEAHRVRPHLEDESDVRLVVGRAEGGALALPVLVAAHAADLQRPAVQEEALPRIEAQRPQAERLGHLVDHLPGHGHAHPHAVEVRVVAPLPQARPRDRQRLGDPGLAGGDARLASGLRDDRSPRVEDRRRDRHRGGRPAAVRHDRRHLDLRRFLAHVRLPDVHAGRGVVEERDADRARRHEHGRAVEAPVDVEVPAERHDVGLGPVVHPDDQAVLPAGDDERRDLEGEGRVPAAVLADRLAVHLDVGDRVGSLEAQEEAPAGRGRVDGQGAGVGPDAARVVEPFEGVGRVPGVGDGDRRAHTLPVDGGALEGPARVEGNDHAAGRGRRGGGEGEEERGNERARHGWPSSGSREVSRGRRPRGRPRDDVRSSGGRRGPARRRASPSPRATPSGHRSGG